MEDGITPLEDGLSSEFRSAAGLAFYVAEEYIPIKFARTQVLRGAAALTRGNWVRLKKLTS